MQSVQQFPKFGECGHRGQSRPTVKFGRFVGSAIHDGNPPMVPSQLAENILTFWELRPLFNAKAPTV